MSEARTLDRTLPVQGQGQVGTPWWGMVCLIATEAILFAYLIFSYAYLGSQHVGSWPASGPPSLKLAVPATVLLLGSSFVLEWGTRAARQGRLAAGRLATAITLLMGGGFAGLEIREWMDKPFGLAADSYSSIYYLITGTHLAHVLLGLVALAVLLAWSLMGKLHQGHEQHRALGTLYWHFVDVVWLFVFATVYLSPRLT
jgi:heme/copper-type cytochrome/quinol oxidase subunit 3